MDQQSDFKGLDRSLRKQRIIDTAVRMFHEKGYHSATLDDLAKDLGLTKAALYHYVSSKEELLSIIYIQALESFFAEAYRIGELDLAPDKKLRLLIRHHIKHIIIENLAMFAVFFSEENQLPEKDFQKIREEKRKYTKVVESIIQAGVTHGCFRQTDARLQAYAIMGMCNWLYKWYKPEGSPYTPDQIADHFTALLEGGYVRVKDRNGRPEAVESMPRKREIIEQLKGRAEDLKDLIDELEKVL